METPLTALKEAVAVVGGQAGLARAIGRSQPTIWYWLNKLCQVPAEDVLAVEAATGIPRHRLRHDLFSQQLPVSPSEDTSVPRHAGVAPRVKAAKACVADGAAKGGALSGEGAATPKGTRAVADRWAGRTVTCALCDCRLSDIAVRACQAPDCPQSDREAA